MIANRSSWTALTATVAFAFMPIALSAQEPATPAVAPDRFTGTVADFHGKYGLIVRNAHGAIRAVQLHQGTVITPVGLRLERGMTVTVTGQASGGTVGADEIDTPYVRPRVAQHGPPLGSDDHLRGPYDGSPSAPIPYGNGPAGILPQDPPEPPREPIGKPN